MTDEENIERHRESLGWLYPPTTFCYELSGDDFWFPDPRMGIVPENGSGIGSLADCDTCVAVGGDLSPERLVVAYSHGFFPWGEAEDEVKYWHAPVMRFVLFPEKVHVSHSMRTLLNKGRYHVSVNRAFPAVIRECGEVDGRNREPGYWLGEEIIRSFTSLYRMGKGVSVEVWDSVADSTSARCPDAASTIDLHRGGEMKAGGVVPEPGWRLVGGLYGFMVNGSFMGDSMFSLVPSGSKIALIGLARWLAERGGGLIDLQIRTDHLASMGGEYIDYARFLRIVNPAFFDSSPGLSSHPFFTESERERILCFPDAVKDDPSLRLLKIVGPPQSVIAR